jgi:hypothetical protein
MPGWKNKFGFSKGLAQNFTCEREQGNVAAAFYCFSQLALVSCAGSCLAARSDFSFFCD